MKGWTDNWASDVDSLVLMQSVSVVHSMIVAFVTQALASCYKAHVLTLSLSLSLSSALFLFSPRCSSWDEQVAQTYRRAGVHTHSIFTKTIGIQTSLGMSVSV